MGGIAKWCAAPRCVAAGFDVLVTADHGLPFQQNLKKLGIAVVIVSGVRNEIDELRRLIPKIHAAVSAIQPGEWIGVAPESRDSVYDRPALVATALNT